MLGGFKHVQSKFIEASSGCHYYTAHNRCTWTIIKSLSRCFIYCRLRRLLTWSKCRTYVQLPRRGTAPEEQNNFRLRLALSQSFAALVSVDWRAVLWESVVRYQHHQRRILARGLWAVTTPRCHANEWTLDLRPSSRCRRCKQCNAIVCTS
jgi:hypothetical protein